jgi:hypothetical protein
MKNYKTHLFLPRNRAPLYHNKRGVILQRIPRVRHMFIDIAGTQYAGYNTCIDKIVSFLEVRAELYSVACTDFLHEDTYLEGHKLRLIS